MTWTLFGVALCLTPTSREPVLAVGATLAKFLAEVLVADARAVLITRLAGMVARTVIVHWILTIVPQLGFATVIQPLPMLSFLLLLGRREFSEIVNVFQIAFIYLSEFVHLFAILGDHGLGNDTVVIMKHFDEDPEKGLFAPSP